MNIYIDGTTSPSMHTASLQSELTTVYLLLFFLFGIYYMLSLFLLLSCSTVYSLERKYPASTSLEAVSLKQKQGLCMVLCGVYHTQYCVTVSRV